MDDALEATALPSVVTSACMIALLWRFTGLGEVPTMTFAFFTLLPTLSALACLQDKRFLATFHRLFQWLFLGPDSAEEAQNSSIDALMAARHDLLRAFSDRWPAAHRPSPVSKFSAAELSTQLGNGVGPSIASNNSGKSLYDQVRSHLKDHVFSNASDAPIYFMDPSSGQFLRVNEQQKLVFTTTPDASCLFHVVKGKTHHWGFHSTIYQRYIGQNLIGKVVVNSKKMHSWESFRVLERPDTATGGSNGAEKTIYLVLCSARFGKGMWVGKQRRTPTNPSDTYLTKNFTHALPLVYASDLTAFVALSSDNRASLADGRSNSDPMLVTRGPTQSGSFLSMTGSESELGEDFQVPVLSTAERARVVLPWIEDAASKRFFELPDRHLVEVVSTTIARFSVRDMLEFFMDQQARRMCHEKTSQAPPPRSSSSSSLPPASSSSTVPGSNPVPGSASPALLTEKRLSEWHLHPHFGYVRKLSYRPPPPEDGAVGDALPSIAIDQYHSCAVDEKAMQKAVFRSKMYTLSIPHSNCFSVETVFEFQDTQDRDGPYGITPSVPVLQFKCRTGVFFTRRTMFAPQIERGVLDGVKKTCDTLLALANEFRLRKMDTLSPRDAFPPHTLAVEVIQGMIGVVRARGESEPTASSRNRSSLVIHMPWTPAELSPISSGVRAKVGGFFECAPREFKLVVDETLYGGYAVTPTLLFDVLLSDECSFFHAVQKQSGTMEVDIGAWRAARFPVAGDAVPHVRKQLFRMPMTGVAGVDVASIEDYQYYALQPDRLEFGHKIFAKELPDGEHFSIEVLVTVEQAKAADCVLRVYSAIARSARDAASPTDDPLHAAVVLGTERGLKAVWRRVAQVLMDAARFQATAEDARHRIQADGALPTHDELSSRVIDAVTALY